MRAARQSIDRSVLVDEHGTVHGERGGSKRQQDRAECKNQTTGGESRHRDLSLFRKMSAITVMAKASSPSNDGSGVLATIGVPKVPCRSVWLPSVKLRR